MIFFLRLSPFLERLKRKKYSYESLSKKKESKKENHRV
jgi:hypothetical protein